MNKINSDLDNQNKRIKKKLKTLLERCRVSKESIDTEFTHVIPPGADVWGKFNIKNEDNKLLIKLLGQAYKNKLVFSIAEKLPEYGPIKIDADMEIPKDKHNGERLYSEELILETVNLYREAIKNYCDVYDGELEAYIFEKENFSERNNNIKDGFHIIFPYLTLDSKVRHLIYRYVIDKSEDNEMFNSFLTVPIFDKQIVSSNAWMMYGCAKPNGKPYLLNKILSADNTEVLVSTEDKNLVKTFSLRQKKYIEDNETLLNDEYDSDKITEEFNKISSNYIVNDNTYELPEVTTEEINDCKKLVSMLSSKRANNFIQWIEVGFALRNTSEQLFLVWKNWSRQSPKFIEGDCEKRWAQMRTRGYTIKSLHYWAKQDNKKEYTEFIEDKRFAALKKNGPKNHFMTAKALFELYGLEFICTNVADNNSWYRFDQSKHRWVKDPNAGTLNLKISEDFVRVYDKYHEQLTNQYQKAKDTDDKKKINDQLKDFHKTIEYFYDDTFKNQVIKQARYIFRYDEFDELANEKHHLICFENGVFDLNTGKLRQGQPDDNITMSTKINYIPWRESNPYAEDIKNFFAKIFVKKNVRDYFLTILSTCVSGENREEKFYFCTGSGSNGKSLTFYLLQLTLGMFHATCPVSIITQKRSSSNSANPELARLKGTRCGVFQEPGKNEVLNTGIFKELTGNDKIMVRGLFKEPIEIKPQNKYFCCCNELPEIGPNPDGGTIRRTVVFQFESKFTEDPDVNNPLEFLIDKELKRKIEDWAPTFGGYLIHYYINYYLKNKIKEPEEVKISTTKYIRDQNLFKDWFESNIQRTNKKSDVLTRKQLLRDFKDWFKDIHEGSKLPGSKKLYEFLETEMKDSGLNGFNKIIFKLSDDEDNESDYLED